MVREAVEKAFRTLMVMFIVGGILIGAVVGLIIGALL